MVGPFRTFYSKWPGDSQFFRRQSFEAGVHQVVNHWGPECNNIELHGEPVAWLFWGCLCENSHVQCALGVYSQSQDTGSSFARVHKEK